MVMKVMYRKVYKVIAYELTDNGLKRSYKGNKRTQWRQKGDINTGDVGDA